MYCGFLLIVLLIHVFTLEKGKLFSLIVEITEILFL